MQNCLRFRERKVRQRKLRMGGERDIQRKRQIQEYIQIVKQKIFKLAVIERERWIGSKKERERESERLGQ